jgi:hypothetical protein
MFIWGKTRVKLALCLTMKTCGVADVQVHVFVASELVGASDQLNAPTNLTPRK